MLEVMFMIYIIICTCLDLPIPQLIQVSTLTHFLPKPTQSKYPSIQLLLPLESERGSFVSVVED